MPNVQPPPAQPAPVVDQANPPVVRDGSLEDTALEVLDSEDEVVQDMTLSPGESRDLGDSYKSGEKEPVVVLAFQNSEHLGVVVI